MKIYNFNDMVMIVTLFTIIPLSATHKPNSYATDIRPLPPEYAVDNSTSTTIRPLPSEYKPTDDAINIRPLPPEYAPEEMGIGEFEQNQIDKLKADESLQELQKPENSSAADEIGIGDFERKQIEELRALELQDAAMKDLQKAQELQALHPRFKFTVSVDEVPTGATVLAEKNGVHVYIEGDKPIALDPKLETVFKKIEAILNELDGKVELKPLIEPQDQVIVHFDKEATDLNGVPVQATNESALVLKNP